MAEPKNPMRSCPTSPNEARKANRLLVPPQDFECLAPEGFAGGRELNCAPVPEEQTHSKFLFQVKDGLTDGGLGDVNPAGSLGEIQMLGHGSEVTQVTQFHLAQQFIARNYQRERNIRFLK